MLQRLLCVLSLALTSACSDSSFQPGAENSSGNTLVWNDVASTADDALPANCVFYAAVTHGDRIYAIEYGGGLYAFDPRSSSWSHEAVLPTFRVEAGLLVAAGQIFVVGGQLGEGVGVATVEAYDPLTKVWSERAPLPQAVCKPGVATADRGILVIGGDGPTGPTKLVQRYDIAQDSWSLGAEMPTRRCALSLAVYDGRILAIGGIGGGSGDWWHIVRTVQEYDPATDTWIDRFPLPEPRDRLSVVSLANRIFVLAGRTTLPNDRASNTVYEYDPKSDRWQKQSPLHHDRFYHASTTMNEAIYVFGGRTDTDEVEATVERGTLR